jgi:hypothetical protein
MMARVRLAKGGRDLAIRGCSSVVERHVANVNVVSSSLITRCCTKRSCHTFFSSLKHLSVIYTTFVSPTRNASQEIR